MATITLINLNRLSSTADTLTTQQFPALEDVLKIQIGLAQSTLALNQWVNSTDSSYQAKRKQTWLELIKPALSSIKNISLQLSFKKNQNNSHLVSLTKQLNSIEKLQLRIQQIAHTDNNLKSKKLFKTKISSYFNSAMISFYKLVRQEEKQPTFYIRRQLLIEINQLQHQWIVKNNALSRFLESGDPAFPAKFIAYQAKLQRTIDSLLTKHSIMTLVQQKEFKNIIKMNQRYEKSSRHLLKLRIDKDWNQAVYLLQYKMTPALNKIDQLIDKILHQYRLSIEQNNLTQQNNINAIVLIQWLALSIAILLSLILAYLMGNNITRLMTHASSLASDLASGKLNITLPSFKNSTEADILLNSFSKIAVSLQQLTKTALAIGEGNYNIQLTPRSEADQLSFAMNKMSSNLLSLSNKTDHESWFRAGQNLLAKAMSGEHTLEIWGDHFIRCLTDYSQSQIGIVFHLKENQSLHLIASNGWSSRQYQSSKRHLTGLLEETIKSKQALQLENISIDGLSMSTGLFESRQISLLIIPIIFENKVIGVIELATIHVFSKNILDFINASMSPIAISMNTTLSRQRINQLFKQAEQQSSLLKLQTKELQLAQKATEEKALQLEKTGQFKSEFMANMSHELRTPLNSLLILANLLQKNKQGNLSADEAKSAKVIYDSGQHLLELINQILDLAKSEANEIQLDNKIVQLKDVLEMISSRFHHMAEDKNIEFKVTEESSLPISFECDDTKLNQILTNLIGNAIKFTSRGAVTLTVGCIDNKQLFFAVKDTGIGIKADHLSKIFDAFKQVDASIARTYGGTGLGLSIAMNFARLMGGEIKVASELQQGTTFTLFLPLKQADAPIEHIQEEITPKHIEIEQIDKPASPPPVKTPKTNQPTQPDISIDLTDIHLMLVDKNMRFAFSFSKTLRNAGATISIIADIDKMKTTLSEKHQISQILLDTSTAEQFGFDQLINDIQSINPALKIIMMDDDNSSSNNEKYLQAGIKEILKKPIDLEKLEALLKL
ncbi:MAG: hypothetical protein HON94_02070 [Methylococcales bacterium]|nr:hypothetical protein [Methylococcales bacterium]